MNATRDLDRVGEDALADGAKTTARKAQKKVRSRPGGGTYPRRAGMITFQRRPPAVVVAASRFPWAIGAEWGSRSAWVFGRRVPATSISRRQFPPFRGNTFSLKGRAGYLVAPVLRRDADGIGKDALEEVLDEYVGELRKRGVAVRR